MKQKLSFNFEKHYKVTLTAILFFSLIIRIFFFQGIDTSDPLVTTRYAYDLANGDFPTSQHQVNSRIGLLIPVAFLYKNLALANLHRHFFHWQLPC